MYSLVVMAIGTPNVAAGPAAERRAPAGGPQVPLRLLQQHSGQYAPG